MQKRLLALESRSVPVAITQLFRKFAHIIYAFFTHLAWGMTSEKPFSDIAARIRWHRTLEGLNQATYARRAGMKRSQLSNWELGVQRISIDGAIALRRTYGLSLDFIYEGIADTLPISLRKAWLERPEANASR